MEMGQLLLCGVIFLVQIILYWMFGNNLCNWMKVGKKGILTLVVGFFGYFGLFQIVTIPFICLKMPFHILVIVWGIICAGILMKGVFRDRKTLIENLRIVKQEMAVSKVYLAVGVAVLVVFLIVYQAMHYYTGFDTAYYVGNINTTLYTDSMYLYDGSTGLLEKYIDMRYALSGFYMNTAFWCRVFGVSPIIVQNYGMGSICILMAAFIMFLIGRKVFGKNTEKAYIYTGLILLLNLFFVSGFSTADFLVYRGYEAKGFCANVVIPAMFYGILEIWEGAQQKEKWKLMFLIAFSSVPISMSSILIVPAMIGIITLVECLIQKKAQLLWYGIICALPNVIYLILYFLYTKKIWLIQI